MVRDSTIAVRWPFASCMAAATQAGGFANCQRNLHSNRTVDCSQIRAHLVQCRKADLALVLSRPDYSRRTKWHCSAQCAEVTGKLYFEVGPVRKPQIYREVGIYVQAPARWSGYQTDGALGGRAGCQCPSG